MFSRSLASRPIHLQLSRRAFSSSRREAPLPALNNPVENAIAAAQQRGDLNNLSGAGKPLKQGPEASRVVPTGMTSSELLSKKAEFEMRRAAHNKELDFQGQKMVYKGTSIVSTSLGGGGDGGKEGSDLMKRYVIEQAQPSAQDLKP